eukprot:4312380-Amphidinium_carterae.1
MAGIGINIEEVPARHCSPEVIDGICAVGTWCERHGIPLQVIARSSCQISNHLGASLDKCIACSQGAYFGIFSSCSLGSKWCAQVAAFALAVSGPALADYKCHLEEFGMCAHIPFERQMSCTSAAHSLLAFAVCLCHR